MAMVFSACTSVGRAADGDLMADLGVASPPPGYEFTRTESEKGDGIWTTIKVRSSEEPHRVDVYIAPGDGEMEFAKRWDQVVSRTTQAMTDAGYRIFKSDANDPAELPPNSRLMAMQEYRGAGQSRWVCMMEGRPGRPQAYMSVMAKTAKEALYLSSWCATLSIPQKDAQRQPERRKDWRTVSLPECGVELDVPDGYQDIPAANLADEGGLIAGFMNRALVAEVVIRSCGAIADDPPVASELSAIVKRSLRDDRRARFLGDGQRETDAAWIEFCDVVWIDRLRLSRKYAIVVDHKLVIMTVTGSSATFPLLLPDIQRMVNSVRRMSDTQ